MERRQAIFISPGTQATFTVDLNFVDNANAEICDYSLFTLQFHYIEKLTYGVLGTNLAATSWLHWSPVSGDSISGVYL